MLAVLLPSFLAAPTAMRVRQVLDTMTAPSRASLRRLIPVGDPPADIVTARYPAAILAYYPKAGAYPCLGLLAESMLRYTTPQITLETLCAEAGRVYRRYFGGVAAPDTSKIVKSKTTQPFIDLLIETRKQLDAQIRGTLEGESMLVGKHVMGHPDARTADQIFEIKLTGDLKKNWSYFVCQVYAYAALDTSVKDVYLVLPLQSCVVHFDVRAWSGRDAYRTKLEAVAEKRLAAPVVAAPAPPPPPLAQRHQQWTTLNFKQKSKLFLKRIHWGRHRLHQRLMRCFLLRRRKMEV